MIFDDLSTLKHRIMSVCRNSQKGRELCMGTSLMAAVTLIVVGVTLLFTLHLSDAIVETTDISVSTSQVYTP